MSRDRLTVLPIFGAIASPRYRLLSSRVVLAIGLAPAFVACAVENAVVTSRLPLTESAVSSTSTVSTETSGVPTETAVPSTTASAPADLAGGRLMFSRFDESTHTFISAHLIRPDGSQEVELPLPGPEGGGRWSRDGSLIAVATILDDGRIGTAIIQPDGTVERIFEIPDETLNLPCTVWSPDDSRLACEAWDDTDPSRHGIYTIRASDGGGLRRLTAPAGMHDWPGDYSPDGTEFVFKRTNTSDEAPGPLLIVDVAGGGEPETLKGTFEDPGRFSPDGTSLLTSAFGRINLIDLDGNVLDTIADGDASLFGAVWSPDGEWIAYSRSSGGFIADIIISRPNGSDHWQVTHTPTNEIVVEWGTSP